MAAKRSKIGKKQFTYNNVATEIKLQEVLIKKTIYSQGAFVAS